jgi:hypothetical protein
MGPSDVLSPSNPPPFYLHSQIEASKNFMVPLLMLCMHVCLQIHLTLEEIVLCELAIALP